MENKKKLRLWLKASFSFHTNVCEEEATLPSIGIPPGLRRIAPIHTDHDAVGSWEKYFKSTVLSSSITMNTHSKLEPTAGNRFIHIFIYLSRIHLFIHSSFSGGAEGESSSFLYRRDRDHDAEIDVSCLMNATPVSVGSCHTDIDALITSEPRSPPLSPP